MSIENLVKSLQTIMRKDAGLDSDAQRIATIVWILFLKLYNAQENEWELEDEEFTSILEDKYRWDNWANDDDLTGDRLLEFINELFKYIHNLEITEGTKRKYSIVKEVFDGTYNYMKDGYLLKQVINKIDEIDFDSVEERHAFNDIYENILKDLQNAGNAGEFYTPKALTDFIAEIIDPKKGNSIADFACGTGGLLTSCLTVMEQKYDGQEFAEFKKTAVHGVEKKGLPYLLCTTKMLLHGIEEPDIIRGNTLERDVTSYTEDEKYDVIVMNPPYGGIELETTQENFPTKFRTKETADLFLVEIMYRLKKNGKCAVVLPDSIIFGTDKAKVEIKKKLVEDFNLHTIVRLPEGIFAPYTGISCNVLFFDNTEEKTTDLWIYEHKAPTGNGKYTKSKQLKKADLEPIKKWWNNREESEVAHKVSIEQIVANGYNLNFKNELAVTEEVLEEPEVIIERIEKNMSSVQEKINVLKGLLGK